MADQIKLTLTIELGPNGEVTSSHDFASYNDSLAAMKWPSGGLRHIAQGLLLEAVRREAFASLMVKMTADPEFIPQYQAATPENRSIMENDLAQKVQSIILRNSQKMFTPSIQEALYMVQAQLPTDKKE